MLKIWASRPMVFLTDLATNASSRDVGIVLYSGNDDALIAHRGTESWSFHLGSSEQVLTFMIYGYPVTIQV